VASVTRKVHFYRAYSATGEELEVEDALQTIDSLDFSNAGRYLRDRDGVLSAWIDRVQIPARLRFGVVRRENLPAVELGGSIEELEIDAGAGLLEPVHIVWFPQNIVGLEFNFYGPRASKLARYLGNKGDGHVDGLVLQPLVRRDVADLLDQFAGLRLFDFRARQSEIEVLENIDSSLAQALRAQQALGEADQLEVIIRTRPYGRGDTLGADLMERVKRLAGHEEIADLASRFRVEGVSPDGGPSREINILDDKLIAEREIERAGGRAAGLNPESAYTQISDAYDALEDDLLEALSIEAG
jgi:hypothetical protein